MIYKSSSYDHGHGIENYEKKISSDFKIWTRAD